MQLANHPANPANARQTSPFVSRRRKIHPDHDNFHPINQYDNRRYNLLDNQHNNTYHNTLANLPFHYQSSPYLEPIYYVTIHQYPNPLNNLLHPQQINHIRCLLQILLHSFNCYACSRILSNHATLLSAALNAIPQTNQYSQPNHPTTMTNALEAY